MSFFFVLLLSVVPSVNRGRAESPYTRVYRDWSARGIFEKSYIPPLAPSALFRSLRLPFVTVPRFFLARYNFVVRTTRKSTAVVSTPRRMDNFEKAIRSRPARLTRSLRSPRSPHESQVKRSYRDTTRLVIVAR